MRNSTTVPTTETTTIPPLCCQLGGENASLSDEEVRSALHQFLSTIVESTFNTEESASVLILPPDYTRFHSQAGKITQFIHEFFVQYDQRAASAPPTKMGILPALGTHAPMTQAQIRTMFGATLASLDPSPFIVHDWRKDVVTIGHVPADMVKQATNGMVDTPWPAQLNKRVWEEKHSLILSVGQVVPHEVMGMANFNKNLFVGVGGVEAINLSHFIGAVHGMEKMMGKANNPLREILNYASEHFLQNNLPLWYILTVMGTNKKTGTLEMKGFYIGNDIQCYLAACDLSLKLNFTMLDEPLQKVVVYLDDDEFHSTWLGNKAIYRTRMAIADGGQLIILAPGVSRFGEDDQVDALIRKYGYRGTPATMEQMKENEDLKQNLSAVAHLIHGSSEGRFSVTYCPGHLTKEEVEGVGFEYGNLEEMQSRYQPCKMKDGWIIMDDGEKIYYISNPALGLWAVRSRFEENSCNISQEQEKGELTQISQQSSSDGSGGVGGWMKPPTE